MLLSAFQHPLGMLESLIVVMIESKFSASEADWQSAAVPRLRCPLLSHVPDETVSLNVSNVPVEHDTSHALCPMAVVVLPAGQSVQLVCPVEPPVDLPATHDLHAASLVCPGPASENLPVSSHTMQVAWSELVYWPAAQSVQALGLVCPVELLYLPAAHDLHAASLVCPGPASENLPTRHFVHTAGDDELSTKDPAGQVDTAAQLAKQTHGCPFVPHTLLTPGLILETKPL